MEEIREQTQYDFDEIIDRKNTNAESVEAFRAALFRDKRDIVTFPCKEDELIRMWVADMEFATPEVIHDGIRARLDQRILGYTSVFDPAYYQAFSSWTKRRYDWTCEKEQLFTSDGVVPALFELVDYICKGEEKVLIFTPSYGPFVHAAIANSRACICSDLVHKNGAYTIDFDDFEEKLKYENVSLCIFCNPHNPTGRIWSQQELSRVARLCRKYGIWIISDEIHCDLLRSDKVHTPLAKILPDYDRIITCMAPSKTFNMAGLMFSNVIIPNAALRKTWRSRHHNSDNPLSIAATQAAYEKGESWHSQLLRYLDGNLKLVEEILQKQLPETKFQVPEASYLAWIDLSHYLATQEDLIWFFATGAGVLLEDGSMFVQNGKGHIRLNIACPRSSVQEAMERICKAVKNQLKS